MNSPRLSKQDLIALTNRLQMDLRDAQAKLVELRSFISALDIPEDATAYVCGSPQCGLRFRTAYRLAEHEVNVHEENPLTEAVAS